MKPTFIIVGEQKSGTGWLRDRLQEHKDVYIVDKEINFFNRLESFGRGTEWYFSHFDAGAGKRAVGEKSPEYFWIDSGRSDYIIDIARKIDETLNHAKLIVSLRNPIDRAVSAFQHHLRHRGRRISPGAVTHHSTIDLLLGKAGTLSPFGVIERGFYAKRLKEFLDRFGDRLLTLVFEDDIVANPEHGLRRVCEHIGIDFEAAGFRLQLNEKIDKPSLVAIKLGYWAPFLRPVIRKLDWGQPFRMRLTREERTQLAELYREDVIKTRELLGRPVWPEDWPQ
jgi:hypothetical protein